MNIHRLCIRLSNATSCRYTIHIFILHYAAIAENFNLNIECWKKKNVPCVLPPSSLNVVRFLSANQYSDERFLNTKQKTTVENCIYENIFGFVHRKCIRIFIYFI